MVGEIGYSQIIVNLPVTNVRGCIGRKAKTLRLKDLLILDDVGSSGGPPKGTRMVHHGMDKLLIQQNTIPDGETTSPVQERSRHPQYPCRFISYLIDMPQLGECL